jgi:glycosyltransferase involved in cell wall biosynthesis
MSRRARIVVINTRPEERSRAYADEAVRWGEPGDYELARQAMRDNGLELHEVEVPAALLDSVVVPADLYLLRDWRFPPAVLDRFLETHQRATTILDLRIAPPEVHFAQRDGEMSRWLGEPWRGDSLARCTSDVLRRPTITFVGSRLNLRLLAALDKAAPNMRVRLHTTPWIKRDGRPSPALISPHRRDRRPFRVLFVGRCMFRKGLPRLYQALRTTGLRRWQLTVVTHSLRGGCVFDPNGLPLDGRVPIVSELLADARVRVLPWGLPPPDLLELYGESHLVACPSLSDNGPNVAIEALACGVPVLLSDMCGAVEALPESHARVVPVPQWWRNNAAADSPERMAAALLEFHDETVVGARAAEVGRAALEEYLRTDPLGTLYRTYREAFQVPGGSHGG